jgi:hypothetical protein
MGVSIPGATCSPSGNYRKCAAPAPTFTLNIAATFPPPRGYTLYQITLRYSNGLNIINREGMSESKIPCLRGSRELLATGRYELTCSVATFQRPFVGPPRHLLANITFTCKEGVTAQQQIDLVGGAGPKVSLYTAPSNQTGSTNVYLKSTTKSGITGNKTVADAMLVNCNRVDAASQSAGQSSFWPRWVMRIAGKEAEVSAPFGFAAP